jgi:hypothetical protein
MGKPKNPKNPSSEPEQRRLPKKVASNWNERGKGTPAVGRVHEAHKAKKITFEEAVDLNPKYTGLSPGTVNFRKRKGKHGAKTDVTKLSVGPDGAIGRRPYVKDVATAHKNKKITMEEARDLNPHYGASKPTITRVTKGDGTPSVTDLLRATAHGHIDVEQAVDLNPKYANKAARYSARSSIKSREEVLPRSASFNAEMAKIMGGGN